MDEIKVGLRTANYYESLQTFKTLLARKVTGPRKDQRAALDMVDAAFPACCNASCAADIASSLFHVLDVFHIPLTDNLLQLMLKFARGIFILPDGLAPCTNFLQDAVKYIQTVGYGDCSLTEVDKILQMLSDCIFSRWTEGMTSASGKVSSNSLGRKDDLVDALKLSARAPEAQRITQQFSVVATRIITPEASQICFAFFLSVVASALANERFRGSALRAAVKAMEVGWPAPESAECRFVKSFRLVLALDKDERQSAAQPFAKAYSAWLDRVCHGADASVARVLSL